MLIGEQEERGEGVPEWAGPYTTEQFQDFLGVVNQDMSARGLPYRVDLDRGVLTFTPPGLSPDELEMWSLADDCAWRERGDWAAKIRDVMDMVIRGSVVSAITFEQLAADWSLAAGWLRVHFSPQWEVEKKAADLVWWEVAPRLNAVLEYGLPHRHRPVPPEHVRGWGRPQDELFRVAVQNLRNGPKLSWGKFAANEETYDPEVFHYTASHVLFLEDYLDPVPPEGVILGVPKGSEFDVFRLREGVDEEFLRKMYLGEREEYLESSGQVSPDLYWWRNGVITSLIDYSPKRPELRLPAELAAILSSLAPRRGNS